MHAHLHTYIHTLQMAETEGKLKELLARYKPSQTLLSLRAQIMAMEVSHMYMHMYTYVLRVHTHIHANLVRL